MTTAGVHSPSRVAPSFREKLWGSTLLAPWFENPQEKIGEVWFEPGSETFPILTKFIFTTEKLSVQVHPDDNYAAQYECSRGKTEMWYILRADPGAQIALGLRERLTREQLREAAESGAIMRLLNWIDVSPGQCLFVPAGTVHAIGGGLALVEIQQLSDVTYRLYDYARPRELHLDRGIEVSNLEPYVPPSFPEGFLAWCPYFVTQELVLESPERYQLDSGREHLLITIEGAGWLHGHSVRSGQVWHIPAGAEPFAIEPAGPLRMLRTYTP